MEGFTHEDFSAGHHAGPHDFTQHSLHDAGIDFAAHAAGAASPGAAAPGSGDIGNPNEYEHYWFFQGKDGYCGPSSITQVIEAQSGHQIHSYADVVNEMHRLHIPFDGSGMAVQDIPRVLDAFGIHSHLETPSSPQQGLQQLASYLQEGRSVILSVNASPIWYGSDTAGNPGGAPDHALVVTAIDPVHGTVTLSDPGSPDGNEETVPLSTFMDAWDASHDSMIVTDHAAGTQDSPVWQTTNDLAHGANNLAERTGASAGFVLLPVALGLGVRRIARAARDKPSQE
jgi:hypothetical protein